MTCLILPTVIIVKIEEDRLFLKAQREKGRRRTMGGVDRSLTLKEKRVMKRKAAAARYALKVRSAAAVTPTSGDLHSDDSSASDSSSCGSTSTTDLALG